MIRSSCLAFILLSFLSVTTTASAGKNNDGSSAWEVFDTNQDGAISKDEALQAVRQLFDSMDTNKDGKLDPDELHGIRHSHRSHTSPSRPAR